ncbi:MAG TPA: HD domain-containing phosphohydrolase [Chthonomonadales bacterium]|nr:HD domain-containing phosphohydrolase [Chthonomonadales bacterium]
MIATGGGERDYPEESFAVTRAPHCARLLVIDDDDWIREVLARALVKAHYRVHTAASAEEALEMIRYASYELILCDVRLGGMTGLDFTRHLTQRHPSVPIVLITAHSDLEQMRSALRVGAVDFLPKPLSIATLPLVIERNLERRALERKREIANDDIIMYNTVEALAAAIDAKEPFTAQHSHRVAALCNAMAEVMKLPEPERRVLALAAEVHDVGKIGTPDYILKKPGRLNEEEWEVIRQHPLQGAQIVGRVPQLNYVADVVRHHHEWINGSGYPDGLANDAIPLLSRVIAVADAYEVMTAGRVYSPKVVGDDALARLREATDTQFDRAVVEAFSTLDHQTAIVSAS